MNSMLPVGVSIGYLARCQGLSWWLCVTSIVCMSLNSTGYVKLHPSKLFTGWLHMQAHRGEAGDGMDIDAEEEELLVRRQKNTAAVCAAAVLLSTSA